MRIPLDYYRILGIPLQVTGEQIAQSYNDRSRQLPRQEYTMAAIAARKSLLDEAYQILTDADSRGLYDSQFLEQTAAVIESAPVNGVLEPLDATRREDPLTPQIDLETANLVGALLILQELGEYELVIRLGEEYLDDAAIIPTRADVLLNIALAYLELSREHWQNQDYEKAALAIDKAFEYAETTQSFPAVIQEIHYDRYRLRPYRILELLSQDLGQTQLRGRGLTLLAQMLEDRQGIDGRGDDRSGLGNDNFLRFIQQLRIYLTLEEQQKLFEKEAQRPSAVARYLKVYVLIAKGFAKKQPASIVQANECLSRLQKHQDVSLEQAICSLLLGQTKQASTILEKSQEKETLNYIKEQSQGEPDLLRGLCRYGEKWLQTEVFSHFRDLVDRTVSLKDYFANETVQNYLEELSGFPHEKTSPIVLETSPDLLESEVTIIETETQPAYPIPSLGVIPMRESAYSYSPNRQSTAARGPGNRQIAARSTVQSGEAVTEYQSGNLMVTAAYRQPPAALPRRRPRAERPMRQQIIEDPTIPVIPQRQRRQTKRRKLRLDRVVILGLGLVGTIAALGFGVKALMDSQSPLAALTGEQLSIELNTPLLEIPSANAFALESTILTQESAKEVIQAWLSAKANALGNEHQTDKLSEILIDPALSQWRNRAIALRGTNYWQYDHKIEVQSVTNNAQNKNTATVEAKIREKAEFFQKGKLSTNRSYDDTIHVRYDLVRQNDRWFVQNARVINH